MPYPGSDGINLFLWARTNDSYSFLPLMAPIIACIPFANSYIIDLDSGILNYLYVKIDRKKYFLTKLTVNALISGTVFLIVQALFLVVLIAVYGINGNRIETPGAFSSIYYSSKIAYAVFLLIMSFIYGVVFSTLALGISAAIHNKYLTVIIPFIYGIITGTIFEVSGLNKVFDLNIVILFDISYRKYVNNLNVVIYDVVLFLAGLFLLFYFGVKKVMNKLLKFMKLNLPKKKITYTTAILFVLFNFLSYNTFISHPLMKRQSVYDLSIDILGEYLNLTYFFFVIFMLFIYNVENKKVLTNMYF